MADLTTIQRLRTHLGQEYVTKDDAFLCAAAQANVITFGRADAQSPAQCSGGW